MASEEKKLNNEISLLKKQVQKLKAENSSLRFKAYNFQEFLAKAYVSPKFLAPFSKEDKQSFAFMDYIGKYLRSIVSKTNDLPLVSIIMPTFNRRNVIQNAIDSVLSQTYTNFELLIIDDGSEDDTIDFLNSIEDDRIKILVNGENKGSSFSRNNGLKNSKGEIIMYLDSDNIWDSKYVETMVGAFIKLPDADALYSGQYLFKGYSQNPYAIRFCSYNQTLLHNTNFIDINCFCHKSYVIDEIGCFDESIWRLVDWDLILRITNHFKVYSVPVLLCQYYEHDFKDRISNMPFDYFDSTGALLSKNKIPIKPYNSLDKKVSIIIINYNSLNEIKECIDSIFCGNLDEMVEVIVVDNDSNIDTLEYLFDLESEGKIKLVLNSDDDINGSIKNAISRSNPDSDLLFLDNDTILVDGALQHLQNCAYSFSDCGVAVPHEMTVPNNKVTRIHVPYSFPQFECDILPSIDSHNIENLPIFYDGGLLELNFVPFFCTYVKREVYDKTLGLDFGLESYNAANRIFSDFIRHELKLKIYLAPDAFVYHKHIISQIKSESSEKIKDIIKNQNKEDANQDMSLWDF